MAGKLPYMQSAIPHKSATRQSLRVFVVEDSLLIREKIAEMLATISGTENIGYASGAEEAIHGILRTHPDAVLLDIRLSQGSGFDVLRAVRAQAPDIAVYILSNLVIAPYRELAERLGATEFFDKSNDFWRMRDALSRRIQTTLN